MNPHKILNALGEAASEKEKHRKDPPEKKKKWIQGAIKHPGALHRSLGVPEGQKIPADKLEKASHSDSPLMRKRANLAKTLKKIK